MGETFISIPIKILKQVEKLPKSINVNNEDTVDTITIEDKRLKDVTEPVEKLPNDVRLENTYNETIVDMEIAESLKQEIIATELSKDTFITTGDGLRGHSECINNIEGNRNVPPTYINVDHGSRWNKNPVWVQFHMDTAASGVEIDEESRRPFLLRVFGLVLVCMLLTFIFAVICYTVPGAGALFDFPVGLILAFIGSVMITISMLKLMCCQYGRRCPCNILGLLATVIGECLVFGYLMTRFRLKLVLLAFGVTCLVVLVCIGLALTPLDFTKCYLFVIIIGVALILFSGALAVMTFVLRETFPILHLVLSCAAIIFFSFCFTMELQQVLGGKTVELGEDDYVVGAFMLYTSMISLFFQILQCIGILDYL